MIAPDRHRLFDADLCVASAVKLSASMCDAWARAFGLSLPAAALNSMDSPPIAVSVRELSAFVADDAAGRREAEAAARHILFVESMPFPRTEMTGEISYTPLAEALLHASAKSQLILRQGSERVWRRAVARLGGDFSGVALAAWCDGRSASGRPWGDGNFGKPYMFVDPAREWLASVGVPWVK